jgi:hypothetical protein
MGTHALRIGVIALLCLLLGTAALAQGGEPSPAAAYAVEPGTAAGAGYRLAGGTWQASGTMSGPGYHLEVDHRPLQGAGCCCTYLPCVMRGW